MDINVLRSFLAVVREGTICAAAKSLCMTQPALTRQMKHLEEELGTKLFTRGRRGIALTDEGRFLEKRARELVLLLEHTEKAFRSTGEDVVGDVVVAGGETRAMSVLARAACTLRTRHPGVGVHLFSGNGDDVKERLDKGLADFGLFIEPVGLARYNFLRLPVKDTWGVLMPKGHPLAARTGIGPRDLVMFDVVLSRQSLVKNELAGWLGDLAGELRVVGTYNLLYNASLLVEEGMGLALCLDGIVGTDGTGPLTFRPLIPRLEVGVCLAWKKEQVFSRAASRFLAVVREQLAEEHLVKE